MEATPNLSLPYIMPSQAQKHVTYNEALGKRWPAHTFCGMA